MVTWKEFKDEVDRQMIDKKIDLNSFVCDIDCWPIDIADIIVTGFIDYAGNPKISII